MASWATKRRFVYGGGVFFILAILLVFAFFKFVYEPPSCSDGAKNGNEKGIDCGGACKNLCTSDTLRPITLWSKIFNISGDVYSAVAYVENPNINSQNEKAAYKFTVYNASNHVILEKEGVTSIPKNKKFAVFETGIVIKSSKPKSVDFQFTSFSNWEKDTTKEPDINLQYSTLLTTTTIPRIEGKITNNSTFTIPQSELTVFVLDSKENVVAASRTFVDNLLSHSTQDFVFTWPKKFDLGVEACVSPVDIVIALDKSGSMKSEGINPPEPFTTVVNTAKDFVKNLNEEDQVGIVSFGTNSQEEGVLSLNKEEAVLAIDNIFFSTTTDEQTNIFGGLNESFNQFKSENSRQDSKKVIVLLTDGLPTEPKNASIADYPTISAQSIAAEIKNSDISIYTIGLGKNVSSGFLKSISTDDSHYFFAPSRNDLKDIYNNIGTSLCTKKPNVITVIFRTI